MTLHDRQAEREQRARAFIETLLAKDVCLSETECEIVQHAAASLIASTEQRVLEEALSNQARHQAINDVLALIKEAKR